MEPPTLKRPFITTLTPRWLPTTPQSTAFSFYSLFYAKLLVMSLCQAYIRCTTTSFNAPAHITKSNHELQHVRSDRKWPTSVQDTSQSQRYLFPSYFSGWVIQLKGVVIYYSPEALGTLQVHQISYYDTLLYLDVLIGQIRLTVSYNIATQLVG